MATLYKILGRLKYVNCKHWKQGNYRDIVIYEYIYYILYMRYIVIGSYCHFTALEITVIYRSASIRVLIREPAMRRSILPL